MLMLLNPESCCWRLDRSGNFLLRAPDDHVSWVRGRKARALIGYLAVHAGQRVTRDRLAGLLWPDRVASQARLSLRQCLREIRQTAPGLVDTDHGHVWIEFRRIALERPQNSSDALEMFDDLNGVSPEFDDWLRCQRVDEADREWIELENTIETLLSQSRGAEALRWVKRMRRMDPYSDAWVQLAIRADRQLGHPAAIVRHYSEFAECLKRDLGILPATETRSLHDRLLNELAKPTGACG